MAAVIAPAAQYQEQSPRLLVIQDERRHREIPVLLYGSGPAKPLAIVSHGYGGQNSEYSFIADWLVARGFLVASIQHVELPTDPPMINSGDLAVLRRPVWQVGADSISVVADGLRRRGLASREPFVAIGHSNGADMTMLYAELHPERVATVISLDGRRMPLPRTSHPHVCSLRSVNYDPDPGVLPTSSEQRRLGMIVVGSTLKHEDMWDGASAAQRNEVRAFLAACLGS